LRIFDGLHAVIMNHDELEETFIPADQSAAAATLWRLSGCG